MVFPCCHQSWFWDNFFDDWDTQHSDRSILISRGSFMRLSSDNKIREASDNSDANEKLLAPPRSRMDATPTPTPSPTPQPTFINPQSVFFIWKVVNCNFENNFKVAKRWIPTSLETFTILLNLYHSENWKPTAFKKIKAVSIQTTENLQAVLVDPKKVYGRKKRRLTWRKTFRNPELRPVLKKKWTRWWLARASFVQ